MLLEKLLSFAARATWRHRSWWILGLLATAGGLLVNLSWRGAASIAADRFSPADLDATDLLAEIARPGVLITGVGAAFLLGLIWWLAGAVAEGGLIVAAASQVDGESAGLAAATPAEISLVGAMRAGLALLGRFIAIDMLLFLPLFLLALALLAVGFGGLAGLVLVATRPAAQFADLLLVAVAATAISLPLVLLMLAVGLVITIMRALAFRAAALEETKAGDSIRRGWRLLRHAPLAVVTLALVLTALRSVAGMPLRFGSFLVAGLSWGQLILRLSNSDPGTGGPGLLIALSGVILALVSWLVSGIMNAFSSAAWTVSYHAWAAGLD